MFTRQYQHQPRIVEYTIKIKINKIVLSKQSSNHFLPVIKFTFNAYLVVVCVCVCVCEGVYVREREKERVVMQ